MLNTSKIQRGICQKNYDVKGKRCTVMAVKSKGRTENDHNNDREITFIAKLFRM